MSQNPKGNNFYSLAGRWGLSPWAIDIFRVYIGDILSTVIGGLTTWLLIRELTVNDYASYTAFATIMYLAPMLIGNGLNLSLIRYSAEHLSKTGRKPFELYLLNFLFQIAIYGLLVVLVLIFSSTVSVVLFGKTSFVPILRYGLIAGLGYLLIQAAMSILKAEEKFGTFVRFLWANKIILFLVIVFVSFAGSLRFPTVASVFIGVNILVGLVITYRGMRGVVLGAIPALFKLNMATCKEFLLSSGWLIGYYMVLALFQRCDIFLLSHLSTERELAIYGVAFQYYAIMLILLGSITTVLAPKFARVEMQDTAVQKKFVFKWIKLTSWIIFPILIVDLVGKSLFVFINGVKYTESFNIFVIFSIGVWLSLMLGPLSNVLVARKEFKFIFVMGAITMVFNFSCNYLLIPHFGGRGAATVVLLSNNIILQGGMLVKILRGNKVEQDSLQAG